MGVKPKLGLGGPLLPAGGAALEGLSERNSAQNRGLESISREDPSPR